MNNIASFWCQGCELVQKDALSGSNKSKSDALFRLLTIEAPKKKYMTFRVTYTQKEKVERKRTIVSKIERNCSSSTLFRHNMSMAQQLIPIYCIYIYCIIVHKNKNIFGLNVAGCWCYETSTCHQGGWWDINKQVTCDEQLVVFASLLQRWLHLSGRVFKQCHVILETAGCSCLITH